jgi:hypothetical protein
MELKRLKGSLAKYGIQTRYESKKEFKHCPYFWLHDREICRNFRNLATREPLKKHNFLSLVEKEFSHPKKKTLIGGAWQRDIWGGGGGGVVCQQQRVKKKKNRGI